MSNASVEIIIILALIMINGFFSMSEIALVSARKIRLEQKAEAGDKGARNALDLTQSTSKLLSSVQIGITLVGIMTGALGGATLAERLASELEKIPWMESSAATVSLAIVVLLTTYFSLVIGELIPKKLALNNPEKIAANVAGVMKAVAWISSPVVKLLSSSTDLGLRILGIKPSEEPMITEEEIKVLIDQGKQIGIFDETEQDMVESVFRLNDRSINAIMTPRTEIKWIDANDSHKAILDQILNSPHSRFPVARETLDNVVGVLKAKVLLEKQLSNQPYEILDLVEKTLFVPENTPVVRVLEMEREHGVHEAMVIDEYGGVQGFVTMFDVLEALIGELPSKGDLSEPEIILRDDGSYLLDGLLPIDEFKELLDLDTLPDEEKVGYQTVGGFVMSQFGSIPGSGQHFQFEDICVEVVDMDGLRVDKVLIYRKSQPLQDEETRE